MKKAIAPGLLLCLLLCGCGADIPETQPETASTAPVSTQSVLQEQTLQQDPIMEEENGGAVCSYQLEGNPFCGIRPMGSGLLLLSEGENGTVLTRLEGENLRITATAQLDLYLDPEDPALQTGPEGVSYYDATHGKTVLLDESLREIRRITLPQEPWGVPLLSADRQTLYFSNGSSLCALEAETGISRVLRQQDGVLILEKLQLEGTVLQCSGPEAGPVTRFFSAENGQLLEEWEGTCHLESRQDRYLAELWQDGLPVLVFGTRNAAPEMLTEISREIAYILLPESYAAVRIAQEQQVTLHYYDLETGHRSSVLTLPGTDTLPRICDGGDGIVWVLSGDGQKLYRWDTGALPSGDYESCTGPYCSRSNPDLAGIAQCRELAQQIGERHGVQVLVWEDVFDLQPWDYRVTEEYLVPVLRHRLEQLDQQLGNFPEGFLAQLSEHGEITICLVRQLTGGENYGSPEDVSGIQYWIDDQACIALSTLNAAEGSLYHELCHIIDTRVYSHSNAYDQWEALNPNGFAYDYDYAANAQRNAGEYLRDAERCFIDTYSMSFPKEDRARILEYAMTEGNDAYFQSKTMQAKLRQICIGLREAFGLKKSPETFLWEQYLQESLAYSK